mmetsp:Transcript_8933/g.26834  ORF Transcript_8933/g.26834 Transcript_8933/m.26834 type:complete len:108 (+) Transcript_8933:99-422(+)
MAGLFRGVSGADVDTDRDVSAKRAPMHRFMRVADMMLLLDRMEGPPQLPARMPSNDMRLDVAEIPVEVLSSNTSGRKRSVHRALNPLSARKDRGTSRVSFDIFRLLR